MSNSHRDPIEAVKAFLGRSATESTRDGGLAGVSVELLEIHTRLSRARQIDRRVSLSESLERLLSTGRSAIA